MICQKQISFGIHLSKYKLPSKCTISQRGMSHINPQEKNAHCFRLRCSFEEKQKDHDSQVNTDSDKFSMHPLCENRHTLNKKLETENYEFNILLFKESGVAKEAKSDVLSSQ